MLSFLFNRPKPQPGCIKETTAEAYLQTELPKIENAEYYATLAAQSLEARYQRSVESVECQIRYVAKRGGSIVYFDISEYPPESESRLIKELNRLGFKTAIGHGESCEEPDRTLIVSW